MDSTELKQRYDVQRSERRTVEGVWDLIEKFIMPYRGKMFDEQQSETSIEWRRREIYDGTAILAAQNLASSLHGSMTPPSMQWFHFRFRNEILNRNVEAMTWLELCAIECYNALIDSNFSLEANEAYLDIVGFGSAIVVEEVKNENEWEGLVFQSVPIRECFFEQGFDGRVIRLYRRYQWTPGQIFDKFGEATPEDIKKKAQSAQSSQEREEIIFCIFRREAIPETAGSPDMKVIPARDRPWGYKYIRYKDATCLGEEGGYYEMPAFIPRWRKTSGSKWGHSPAMIALSDVLTINQLVQIIFKAAEKAIDPANVTTERGLLSDLDLGSGGLTVVRNIDDLKPYNSGANFSVGELNREKLQNQINQAFYVDQLQLKESPAMTATEVQARMTLMQRLIGPTLARLQNDFLDPMVQRTFRILWRAGKLPEIPEIVEENQAELDIEYVSPMYQAQRSAQVGAIQQWVGFLATLQPVQEDILDNVNFDQISNISARLLGVPAEAQATTEQMDKTRKSREADKKRQQLLETGMAMGQTAKDVAQATKATAQAETVQ